MVSPPGEPSALALGLSSVWSRADVKSRTWKVVKNLVDDELLSGSRFRFIVRSRVDHTFSAGLELPLAAT